MLILGCGYIGRRVAHRYLDRGENLLSVVRSPESASALSRDGIPALAVDLSTANLDGLPFANQRVFHFAPPSGGGVRDEGTRRLVSAFDRIGHPKRLVYASTTGVYGDCSGAWVDETRPPCPSVDRARRRWDAEQTLRAWRTRSGSELVILRVAGIYGPGRLPLERIRRALPLVREEESPFSNRIHAKDLVRSCIAAMDRGRGGAVYNVCDGNPSTMTDYFFQIADEAGLPRPPVVSLREAADLLSPGMISYMRESRRLTNRKLREELGVELLFPNLEVGLPDCLVPEQGERAEYRK